jgi:hypothetical protein
MFEMALFPNLEKTSVSYLVPCMTLLYKLS